MLVLSIASIIGAFKDSAAGKSIYRNEESNKNYKRKKGREKKTALF